MSYVLIIALFVVLFMAFYVDFAMSFTRNENGAFSFRIEIGMKKS